MRGKCASAATGRVGWFCRQMGACWHRTFRLAAGRGLPFSPWVVKKSVRRQPSPDAESIPDGSQGLCEFIERHPWKLDNDSDPEWGRRKGGNMRRGPRAPSSLAGTTFGVRSFISSTKGIQSCYSLDPWLPSVMPLARNRSVCGACDLPPFKATSLSPSGCLR